MSSIVLLVCVQLHVASLSYPNSETSAGQSLPPLSQQQTTPSQTSETSATSSTNAQSAPLQSRPVDATSLAHLPASLEQLLVEPSQDETSTTSNANPQSESEDASEESDEDDRNSLCSEAFDEPYSMSSSPNSPLLPHTSTVAESAPNNGQPTLMEQMLANERSKTSTTSSINAQSTTSDATASSTELDNLTTSDATASSTELDNYWDITRVPSGASVSPGKTDELWQFIVRLLHYRGQFRGMVTLHWVEPGHLGFRVEDMRLLTEAWNYYSGHSATPADLYKELGNLADDGNCVLMRDVEVHNLYLFFDDNNYLDEFLSSHVTPFNDETLANIGKILMGLPVSVPPSGENTVADNETVND